MMHYLVERSADNGRWYVEASSRKRADVERMRRVRDCGADSADLVVTHDISRLADFDKLVALGRSLNEARGA